MMNPNLAHPAPDQPPFDPVHDTQKVYRVLLEAMSRPGKVCHIEGIGQHLSLVRKEWQTAASIALTLLDGEVGFCMLPEEAELVDYTISRTFCRKVEASEADYVFARGDADPEFVHNLMGQLKKGTLLAPETSATVILRVKDVMECEEPTQVLTDATDSGLVLTGPGINGKRDLCVRGITSAWWQERAKSNAEYPLGLDWILYTADGKVVGLPRTTKLAECCKGE